MIGKSIALVALAACAQLANATDEIQVYADDINKPGEFGLELHLNYLSQASKTREWPQQVPPDRLFSLTPEFSYGLTSRVELGLYLPMTRGIGEDVHLEGFKGRLKYLVADDANPFYWGINAELGRVSLRTEEYRVNFELRPILGYRTGKWNFTVNPILGWAVSGANSRVPDFSPAFKVAHQLTEKFSVGVEHYAEAGRLNAILPADRRDRHTYIVIDGEAPGFDYNLGVGKGSSASPDRWVIKAILGFRFQNPL